MTSSSTLVITNAGWSMWATATTGARRLRPFWVMRRLPPESTVRFRSVRRLTQVVTQSTTSSSSPEAVTRLVSSRSHFSAVARLANDPPLDGSDVEGRFGEELRRAPLRGDSRTGQTESLSDRLVSAGLQLVGQRSEERRVGKGRRAGGERLAANGTRIEGLAG